MTINSSHPAYQLLHLVQKYDAVEGGRHRAWLNVYMYCRHWEHQLQDHRKDWGSGDAPDDQEYWWMYDHHIDTGLMIQLERSYDTVLKHYKHQIEGDLEMAIDHKVRFTNKYGDSTWSSTRDMYWPFFDGLGQPEGHWYDKMLKKMSEFFPGRTLYIFNSGRSYHGYINTLVEPRDWYSFRQMLTHHDRTIDQAWVERGGGLRWNKTQKRNKMPTLIKWHQL